LSIRASVAAGDVAVPSDVCAEVVAAADGVAEKAQHAAAKAGTVTAAETPMTPTAVELALGAEHIALSIAVAAYDAEAANSTAAVAATVPTISLAADVVKAAHAAAVALAAGGAAVHAAEDARGSLASCPIPRAALVAFVVEA